MTTTTMQRDEKHIFSEFEDEERQKLIKQILPGLDRAGKAGREPLLRRLY